MSDTMIIKRTGQAPLRVRGEVIAENESSSNNASSRYSGSTGRSQKVEIIKTGSGKYVVSILHETCWQGEHDTNEAAVFPDLSATIEFLRNRIPRWMVDDFIDELGPENVAEDVD